jgi:type I restriction enzyme S subunit
MSGARVNQHVCIIRTVDGLLPAYVERFLAAPEMQRKILKENYGFARQALTKDIIEKFLVPVPPAAEQCRIVAKLDVLFARLGRARSELNKASELSAAIRSRTLTQAFCGTLTEGWRSNSELLSEAIPQPQDTKSSAPLEAFPFEIPSTWRWHRLPDLGELSRGKSRHRPRNDPMLFEGPHPFVQTGDVRAAGQYLTTYNATYSDFGLQQSRKWAPSTVCITIAANIAESCILGIHACFPDSVVGFVADAGSAEPEYIEYFIRTAKEDLNRFAAATTQKNINLETLNSVFVPTPPLKEQQEIARRINLAFLRAKRLEAEAARAMALLDRLEAGILIKAFKGKLVPQDPNDDGASVLLDRIKATRNQQVQSQPKRGRKASVPKIPREKAAMTKSRHDEDVKNQPYLANIIREAGGSSKVEDLFGKADLPVTDFYKQLAWEVDQGHILDQNNQVLQAA